MRSNLPFDVIRREYNWRVQKKLVVVGNGVALFIDKEIRRALGLKATSLVQVRTDGKRLIIEPDGERASTEALGLTEEESLKMYAESVFEFLWRNDLPHEVFESCTTTRCRSPRGHVQRGRRSGR